jgi:hypothetical protein
MRHVTDGCYNNAPGQSLLMWLTWLQKRQACCLLGEVAAAAQTQAAVQPLLQSLLLLLRLLYAVSGQTSAAGCKTGWSALLGGWTAIAEEIARHSIW